jgi:hypothetical protein
MANASMLFVGLMLPFLAVPCATSTGSHYWYATNGITEKRIEQVLRGRPPAA